MQVADTWIHEKKIEEIKSNFLTFQNEINSKQVWVKDWAEHLDAIKEKLGIETNEIARRICKELEELNVTISDSWVYESLRGTKYRTQYEENARTTLAKYKDLDSSGGIPQVELPPITKLKDGAAVQSAFDKGDELETQAREMAKLARDYKEQVKEIADKNHFQLEGHKSESISTPRGESRETELSDQLMELSNDILAVREKVIEFPPEEKDAHDWAIGIRDFRQLFRGFTDLKYSKSIPSWFLVQIKNIESGKHAAATIHGTTLPGGIKRSLTREQVGDNAEFILDAAWKALQSFDGLAGLIAWHSKYVEPAVAERKVNVSPKLSELA